MAKLKHENEKSKISPIIYENKNSKFTQKECKVQSMRKYNTAYVGTNLSHA